METDEGETLKRGKEKLCIVLQATGVQWGKAFNMISYIYCI